MLSQARGLGIRLATPSPTDARAARGVKYRSRHKGFRVSEKEKMVAIGNESIFGPGKESTEQARRKSVLMKAARLSIKTRGMRLLEPGATAVPSVRSNSSRPDAGAGGYSSDKVREANLQRDRSGSDVDENSIEVSHHEQIKSGNEGANAQSASRRSESKRNSTCRKKRRKKIISGAKSPGIAGGLAAIASSYSNECRTRAES